MMKASDREFYTRLVKDLAGHFGSSTEVVLHDLTARDPKHSIAALENSHVTGRKVGDGPSHIVLEALGAGKKDLKDRISYFTRTTDGKMLKSSTIYLRDEKGEVIGILGINTDISLTMAMEKCLHEFHTQKEAAREPEPIPVSISDLLDTLIQESIHMVGKPVSLMSKDEKVKAIRFLNDSGAFLITRSGPKVCEAFGISKYTLYNYLDEAKG